MVSARSYTRFFAAPVCAITLAMAVESAVLSITARPAPVLSVPATAVISVAVVMSVVVMSIEKGDRADVIWSGTGYNGKVAWRYYAGRLEGSRIRLFSATGGPDTDEIFLEWKTPTSASFNQHNPLGASTMFSVNLVRLDG